MNQRTFRAKNAKAKLDAGLQPLIQETIKLWRKYHLTYDQAQYVAKEVRNALDISITEKRKPAIQRLSREEERALIQQAYKENGRYGLLIKTLFQTGARVSEFVNIQVQDVYFEERRILITQGKGGTSRYVPILPELAQELKTYVAHRTRGYLFETNRSTKYSSRRIQQIVKEVARKAGIEKRVHPHLLRHSVATTLLERGMPLENIQKFLGHTIGNDSNLCGVNNGDNTREFSKGTVKRLGRI